MFHKDKYVTVLYENEWNEWKGSASAAEGVFEQAIRKSGATL